jgi:hypothetical protein
LWRWFEHSAVAGFTNGIYTRETALILTATKYRPSGTMALELQMGVRGMIKSYHLFHPTIRDMFFVFANVHLDIV